MQDWKPKAPFALRKTNFYQARPRSSDNSCQRMSHEILFAGQYNTNRVRRFYEFFGRKLVFCENDKQKIIHSVMLKLCTLIIITIGSFYKTHIAKKIIN